MGQLFAKDRKRSERHGDKVTDTDRAIVSLKTQKRKLTAERSRIFSLIARDVELARQLIAEKRRQQALLSLRKKKLHEARVDTIDAYLLNVEQLLDNIETAQRQNKLFAALKQGNEAIKQLQKEVTLDDVENLMSDSAEAKEQQDRMRELLGQSLTPEADEAALEELRALEADEEAADAAAQEADLPEVPTHKVEADVEPQVLAPSQPGAMTEAHKRPQAESRQLEEPLAA